MGEADDKFRKKVAEYELFFRKNGEKKAKIEELQEEIKTERRQSKAEENKLRKKLEKEGAKTELEKAKVEKEKKARITEASQKENLIIERDEIKEKLEETEAHWTSLKMDLNVMDIEWDKEKKNLQKKAQDLS